MVPDGLVVCGGVLVDHLHLARVDELHGTADAHRALLRGVRVPRDAALLHVAARVGVGAAVTGLGVEVEHQSVLLLQFMQYMTTRCEDCCEYFGSTMR